VDPVTYIKNIFLSFCAEEDTLKKVFMPSGNRGFRQVKMNETQLVVIPEKWDCRYLTML
jgi:hypothetical protein